MPSNEEIQVKKKIEETIKQFGAPGRVHNNSLSLSLSLRSRN